MVHNVLAKKRSHVITLHKYTNAVWLCFLAFVVRSVLIIKIMETFNLSFSKFIGKNVTLSDEGEYYCGDYISGRFYSGKFGGSFYKSDGIYFKVDDNMIKMDVKTKITFSE